MAATAVAAQIAIPLPGSPVPIVLSNLMAVLAGLLLGARDGAIAMVVYVLVGLAGVPVYAAGHSGAGVLVGPTGGYLVGFVIAAYLAGAVRQRSVWLAAAAAMAVIYFFGVPWLIWTTHLAWKHAVLLGALPFLPGDALKTIAAVAVARAIPTPRG
ncbi:MAG TPA: biotin transporter BioY [bacterium]|nr:biotin transporter BioY [bacterium]